MFQPNRTILIVEDDLPLSASLAEFLEDHGYQTTTAGTAKTGWDVLRTGQVRLCLLDLNLPDGSGLDLLRKLAQAHLGVQVVVMTAFDLLHLRPRDSNRVLAAWLTKPVNPLDLLKIVERVMGEQSMTAAGSA